MALLRLNQILSGQDLGIEKVCEKVLDQTFDKSKDPITAIIINAFENNGGSEGIQEYDQMIMDLDYAINSLQKAKYNISQHGKINEE